MTKNDDAIVGPLLAAILGRWRGACLAVPLLALLGGCVSDGGTRVSFDEETEGVFASADRPSSPERAQSDGESHQDSVFERKAVAAADDASPPDSQKGGSYTVFGKRYHVEASSKGHVEKGLASWYGRKFQGRLTSSGERYNMYAFTAAHKSLPLPTYAEVINLVNGRSVLVKVNDRGPFVDDRVIDLSYAAAKELQMVNAGVAMVEVRAIDPTEVKIDENMFLAANERSSAGKEGAAREAPGNAGKKDEVRLAASDGTPAPELVSAVAESDGKGTVGATAILASATTESQERQSAKRPERELYVKVGEFGNRDSAERLRRRLVDHLAEQVEVQATDNLLSRYAVQIGPLASPAQAKDVSEQLVALGVKGSGASFE